MIEAQERHLAEVEELTLTLGSMATSIVELQNAITQAFENKSKNFDEVRKNGKVIYSMIFGKSLKKRKSSRLTHKL